MKVFLQKEPIDEVPDPQSVVQISGLLNPVFAPMSHGPRTRLVHAMVELAHNETKAIDHALAGVRNRHKGVHEARKAIRRLRALLSFERKLFGTNGEILDRKLRAVGRGLSRLRDAQVSVVTVQALARRANSEDKPLWRAVRDVLSERRERLLKQALSVDPAFRRRRQRVSTICETLRDLPWDTLDEKVIAAELNRSYRRVAKAKQRVSEAVTAANMHRWRRKVRKLRLQLCLLEALREDENICHEIHHVHSSLKEQIALADELGWRQDLQVLRGVVRSTIDVPDRANLLGLIHAEIRLAQPNVI